MLKLTRENGLRTIIIMCGMFGFGSLLSPFLIQDNFFPEANGLSISDTIQSNHLGNNSVEQNTNLGDSVIYTENTKSTNIRVLSISPLPIVEITYNGNSSINGSPTQTIGTIIDTMEDQGVIHSEGKAIILTETGQIITYRSESVGHYNPDGSFSDSGIIFFNSPYQGAKDNETNSRSNTNNMLNTDFDDVLGIYKKTVDPAGNGFMKVWKWS